MSMNYKSDQTIGQRDLIIKDIINSQSEYDDFYSYQNNKITELEKHINLLKDKFNGSNEFDCKIMKKYLEWIEQIKANFISTINENTLYNFYKFDPNTYKLNMMQDYWDVPQTDKLFSFSLFIGNPENLTYFIGLVYNYAIMRKHFVQYKMRLYIDFHSVFGSPETFNLFNMFLDILKEIDPKYSDTIQMVVFFLNPYYNIDGETIYDSIVYDTREVIEYYNNIFYFQINLSDSTYIKSPLLNQTLEKVSVNNASSNSTFNKNANTALNKNIKINLDDIEIDYKNLGTTTPRATFAMFSTHIAVNLRFLPLNESCEFHVRDLDCRLSQTDINIVNKFSNPKYKYVPFYVFQFYKFYFPYLKWRIDVNPYLAGCFGGNNKKPVMISKELEQSSGLKILKKEIFFKYILFISFNASNLQIGFLNDEFILANIFEKIKGSYSENILFLNLGSFANKHVNEYYYGISNSPNYPCILKLGVPIDILRYPLNGKYITIDPITDFKMGTISKKYHAEIKNLITEQLNIYLNKPNSTETNKFANKIRRNYKMRLDDEINEDLEAALFFSMIPKSYQISGFEDEFNSENYTQNSYTNQYFSSIGESSTIVHDENLKASNIMMSGYLLADILEDIIFPQNSQFINSNYYLSDDNYDRLFNCMYFDETKKKFIQRKINKKDISRKYIDQKIIDHIPQKLLEFNDRESVTKSLNAEFNEYLNTCKYYSSLGWYVDRISFNSLITIGGKQIKSGILLFIKNYTEPIYDNKLNQIYSIQPNSVKTLKYKLDKKSNKDLIKGIGIEKNKLKFNVMFIDDTHINHFAYGDNKSKNTTNIKLLKSSHLDKIADVINTNKFNDFLIIDNL